MSGPRKPSGNGTWTMSLSRLTIHSFRAGMPPAICAPSVRPWKAFWKVTMVIFASPATFRPQVRASLIAHSQASAPVVSRKTLSSPCGATAASCSTSSRANLRGEAVVVHQAVLDLVQNRLADPRMVVAGVGHQHAGGPVQPHVAPAVVDLDAFGPVPDHRRLAAHRDGLEPPQPLQDGDRLGHGDLGDDPPVLGLDRGDFAGTQVETRHERETPGKRYQVGRADARQNPPS